MSDLEAPLLLLLLAEEGEDIGGTISGNSGGGTTGGNSGRSGEGQEAGAGGGGGEVTGGGADEMGVGYVQDIPAPPALSPGGNPGSWYDAFWAANGPIQDMMWLVGAGTFLGGAIAMTLMAERYLDFVQGRTRRPLWADTGTTTLSITAGACLGLWALGWAWRQPQPLPRDAFLLGIMGYPRTFSQPILAISLLLLAFALAKWAMAVQIARKRGALARATAVERGAAGMGLASMGFNLVALVANAAAIYKSFS